MADQLVKRFEVEEWLELEEHAKKIVERIPPGSEGDWTIARDTDPVQRTAMGFAGEWLIMECLGFKDAKERALREVPGKSDGGYDVVLPGGVLGQIKTSRYSNAGLIYNPKAARQNKAVKVLMQAVWTGYPREFRWVGWVPTWEFWKLQTEKDFGYGPCPHLAQSRLRTPYQLLQLLPNLPRWVLVEPAEKR